MPVTIQMKAADAFCYQRTNRKYVYKYTDFTAGNSTQDDSYSTEKRARLLLDTAEYDKLNAAGALGALQSLQIQLDMKSTSGWAAESKTVQVRIYAESPDKGEDANHRHPASWTAMDSYYASHTAVLTKKGGLTVSLTDGTEIRYVMENGIGIIDTEEGIEVFYDTGTVAAVVLTSKTEAPSLGADPAGMVGGYFSGDTYIHDPGKAFVVGYSYSQEAGGAFGSAVVSLLEGTTVLYTEEQESYGVLTIPESVWGELPTEGVIRITVQTAEYGGETGKATMDIPYRVAYRNVVMESHMPESTVDSDTDVSLVWNSGTVTPEGASCAAPVFWKVWVSAGEASQGVLLRSPAVVVKHDVLSGQQYITVRIETYYTEDGVVGTYGDNGYSMRLWVRQVAEAGGVSVETDAYGTVPPLPVVSWASEGQTAFRVRFGDFESGAVFGTETSYAVPKVFSDGTYPVQVSVQDKNGRWGTWTSPTYAVVRNRTTSVVCAADVRIHGGRVVLDITGTGDAALYAIYRDGVLIGQAEYSAMVQYTDPWVNGSAVYEVLAITAEGYYASTGKIPVTMKLSDDILTADGRDIVLRYTAQSPMEYTYKETEEVSMVHFSGRRYPVAFRSGNFKRSITLTYADPYGDLAPELERLDGADVFFRDVQGGSIYGILGKRTVRKTALGTYISFEISETDRGAKTELNREDI